MNQYYIALYALEHNKYLCEKTTNTTESYQCHVNGFGGLITQIHTPCGIINSISVNTQQEIDELVKLYTNTYGTENIWFNI